MLGLVEKGLLRSPQHSKFQKDSRSNCFIFNEHTLLHFNLKKNPKKTNKRNEVQYFGSCTKIYHHHHHHRQSAAQPHQSRLKSHITGLLRCQHGLLNDGTESAPQGRSCCLMKWRLVQLGSSKNKRLYQILLEMVDLRRKTNCIFRASLLRHRVLSKNASNRFT